MGIIEGIQEANKDMIEVNIILGEIAKRIRGQRQEVCNEPPRRSPECLNEEIEMLNAQVREAMGGAREIIGLFEGIDEKSCDASPAWR